MKIKREGNNRLFNPIRIIKYASKFKIVLFLFIIILLISFSFMMIYYGAYLQKVQVAANIQQILYNAIQTNISVFGNYINGLKSNPDKLELNIKFKGVQKLNYARSLALSKGRITNKEEKLSSKARLFIGNKEYKVRVSPTGQNLDMIGDFDKRAYKIKVLNGNKINGMKEFKLLPPHSRHNIVEFVGHELENAEGLISLNYYFAELTLNGDNLGVYAVEEHFGKELLERHKSKEGLIFGLRNADINIFNEKKEKNTQLGRDRIRLLNIALQAFKSNQLNVERILDMKKFASFYAIVDLMNGYHALGQNSIFYFNPITNLLEPIIREYNSLRYSDGSLENHELMIERVINKNDFAELDQHILNRLFQNKLFIQTYLSTLLRLSNKEFLDNFFLSINDKFKEQLNIIYREDPFYKFPKEFLYERQEIINKKLSTNLDVKGLIDEDITDLYSIKIINNSYFPIKLINIYHDKGIIKSFKDKILFPGQEIYHTENKLHEITINDINFSYKISGIANHERESYLIPQSFNTKAYLSSIWRYGNRNLYNNRNIRVYENTKSIKFLTNKVNIKNDLYIPKGYNIVGHPGLEISLLNGSSIFSESSFTFIGTESNPIIFKSIGIKSGGIFIDGTNNNNIFTYTKFADLSSPNIKASNITGAVTINNSTVYFNECTFNNNNSEDMLNIINSKYEINNSSFFDTLSDAFDSDFSSGTINNTSFINIGNDALDFSGSESKLSNVNIDTVADKGISAGERSFISAEQIIIENTGIGVTSKDLSNLTITDLLIKTTMVGVAVFQKKEEFGPGAITLTRFTLDNVSEPYLIETNSKVSINGETKYKERLKVEDLLYGTKYGKKSN